MNAIILFKDKPYSVFLINYVGKDISFCLISMAMPVSNAISQYKNQYKILHELLLAVDNL